MRSHEKIFIYQLKDALWFWVYIPSAVIVSGLFLDYICGFSRYACSRFVLALAVFLIVLGCALIFISMNELKLLGQGTPNPKFPPKQLVTSRSYALCRHPMFLGYDLAAFGVLIMIGSPCAIFVSFPSFLYFETRHLKQEEQRLAKRFGDSYKAYCRVTPLLISFTKPRAFSCGRMRDMK